MISFGALTLVVITLMAILGLLLFSAVVLYLGATRGQKGRH